MSTHLGRAAEELTAELLQSKGHKIIEMNWRTRWCEIDVISVHRKIVYFTEVKFRSSTAWGDGLAFVHSKKMRQMNFAAEMWLHHNNWRGESQLQAAAVNYQGVVDIVPL